MRRRCSGSGNEFEAAFIDSSAKLDQFGASLSSTSSLPDAAALSARGSRVAQLDAWVLDRELARLLSSRVTNALESILVRLSRASLIRGGVFTCDILTRGCDPHLAVSPTIVLSKSSLLQTALLERTSSSPKLRETERLPAPSANNDHATLRVYSFANTVMEFVKSSLGCACAAVFTGGVCA